MRGHSQIEVLTPLSLTGRLSRYAKPELGVEFRQVSKVRLIPVLASPKALDDGEAREEAR